MRYGTVVQFYPARGFGFIRPDVGVDVYFHVTAIGACERAPQIEPGQPVKFELMEELSSSRRRRHEDDDDEQESKATAPPARPRAKLVELIDKMPGAILDESATKKSAARHPNARRKKPTWRR